MSTASLDNRPSVAACRVTMSYARAYHRSPPAGLHLVEHTGLALENQLDLGVEIVIDVLPSSADLSLIALIAHGIGPTS